MRLRKSLVISVLTLGMVFSQAKAQGGLAESIQSMLASNATLYLQPFVDAFGYNMNSGWYYRSGVHKFLGFDVSVKAAATMVSDNAKTFNFLLSENQITLPLASSTNGAIADLPLGFDDLYRGSNTATATVFGAKDGGSTLTPAIDYVVDTLIHNQAISGGMNEAVWSGLSPGIRSSVNNAVKPLALPNGFGVNLAPLPIVQASVGLPMGTEVSVRFFPEQDLGDYGKFSFYGGGLRLNLDQFIPIPLFPVDITAGAFYQQMKIGDLLNATNLHYSLQVGKSINLLIFGLGVYVDAGMDQGSIDVSYDAILPDGTGGTQSVPVNFSFDAKGGVRYGAGFFIKPIPFININANYNQTADGDQIATLGLAVGLR